MKSSLDSALKAGKQRLCRHRRETSSIAATGGKHVAYYLFLLWLLAACSTQHIPPANTALANDVLFNAMDLVGTPYRYGGNTPESGFDCSGLVGYVYHKAARLDLPRSTAGISRLAAPTVPRQQLSTGDIVLFSTGMGLQADHTGIYVGEGRFVHAPSRGGTVRLDRLDERYWQAKFLFGKRPLAAGR